MPWKSNRFSGAFLFLSIAVFVGLFIVQDRQLDIREAENRRLHAESKADRLKLFAQDARSESDRAELHRQIDEIMAAMESIESRGAEGRGRIEAKIDQILHSLGGPDDGDGDMARGN